MMRTLLVVCVGGALLVAAMIVVFPRYQMAVTDDGAVFLLERTFGRVTICAPTIDTARWRAGALDGNETSYRCGNVK